nr:helix-turn-helix domain-containing protein [Modestobacter muralis]
MGRPRGFDEAVAVTRAAEVFAELGYDGASVDDVQRLGVHRGSLYSTSGSKRALYLRVLGDHVDGLARAADADLTLLLRAAVERAPVDPEAAALVARGWPSPCTPPPGRTPPQPWPACWASTSSAAPPTPRRTRDRCRDRRGRPRRHHDRAGPARVAAPADHRPADPRPGCDRRPRGGPGARRHPVPGHPRAAGGHRRQPPPGRRVDVLEPAGVSAGRRRRADR